MAEPTPPESSSPYRKNAKKDGKPPYRELTFAALALGVVQGAVLTASFVYIGLRLGFGISGSTVAAITGFALLRGVGRKAFKVEGCGSILETNINQTIASGINTASAGVVFTFPALFLLGFADEINYGHVLLAAVAGSFMGIVVIIPLRKQMIEIERLRFPSGIAVASILRAPGAGAAKAKLLLVGFAVACTLTLLTQYHVIPETLEIGSWFLDDKDEARGGVGVVLLSTSLALSMANFGAGLLSGKGGLAFAAGGVLSWWIIAPYVASQGWIEGDPGGMDLWGAVYFQMLRPVGIGVLIGGALSGVVLSYPALKGAMKSLGSAAKLASSQDPSDVEELPPKVLLFGLVGSFIALFTVAFLGADGAIATAISVAVAGTVWLGLAGLIVAQATGATDISPLSGLALIAVTLMLAITANNVMLAVTIGVAVCVATNQCADMMSDLKTGHLVGGIPRRQQLAQFMVAWVGPMVAIGTVVLLWKGGEGGTGGFGPGTDLLAPQAGALQAMVEGVVGGNAPLDKYFAGALIGGGLAFFPISGLGVLIGLAMYLPFEITLPYGIGCVISMVLEKRKGRRFYGDVIVPIGAGLIIGEALTSITFTIAGLIPDAFWLTRTGTALKYSPLAILVVVLLRVLWSRRGHWTVWLGRSVRDRRAQGGLLFVLGLTYAAWFASFLAKRDIEGAPSAQGMELVGLWMEQAGPRFAGGLVLMMLGGALARRRSAGTSADAESSESSALAPAAMLESIEAKLLEMNASDLPVGAEKLSAELDKLLNEDVPAFIDQRTAIIDELGLEQFAEMIGHFSSMERAAARTWSALMDEAYAEAVPSLARAKRAAAAAKEAYTVK